MWFSVLGPVEVSFGGLPVPIERAQRRAVLAYLLLNAGKAVSGSQLVDALWGEDPPATAKNQIQMAVSHIRRALRVAGHNPIDSIPGGYRLTAAERELDLALFTSRVHAARSADTPEAAVKDLRDALGLWRGSPLSGIAAAYAEPARVHLWEEYHAAYELLADIELERGRYEELIPELTVLAEANPLRERFTARLMLALYRTGRQGDALAAYRRLRDSLVVELGVEPAPELQHLHRSVLANDPALLAPLPVARPRGTYMLPRDIPDFTGRADNLAALDTVADAATGTSGAVVISTVAGIGGVGKTALAVHWAHRESARFPDGLVYLDLRGYGPGEPMRPAAALGRLLRALGIAPRHIPADEDAAGALYRATMAIGTRLIVLDNSQTADQVRPLLPGASTGLVIVTSRDRLSGMVAFDGAQRIVVDALTPAESIELLGRVVGDHRTVREPDAAANLVRLCGYLPLAIRLAAAHLADSPTATIADLCETLRGYGPLDALDVDGDPAHALRTVFHHSYRYLNEPERRVFRLISVVPGSDIAADTAAEVVGYPATLTATILSRLVAESLLTEYQPGRYAQHDLIREFGMALAAEEDAETHRAQALGRLGSWYLGHAEAAARLLSPMALALEPAGTSASFADPAGATAWMHAEQFNIRAFVELMARVDKASPIVWQLVAALTNHWYKERATVDLLHIAALGLTAATAAGDLPGQVILQLASAKARFVATELEPAFTAAQNAARLLPAVEWPEAEVTTANILGHILLNQGRLPEAAEYLNQALQHKDSPVVGRATTLHRLGVVYGMLGRLAESEHFLIEALAASRDQHRGEHSVATDLTNLTVVYRLQGRFDEATGCAEEAMSLYGATGHHHSLAIAQMALAKTMRDQGRYKDALSIVSEAWDVIADSTDEPSKIHAVLTKATTLSRLGDHELAKSLITTLLPVTNVSPYLEAETQCSLAEIQLGLGDAATALTTALGAAHLCHEAGYQLWYANARIVAARSYMALGLLKESRTCAQEALDVHRRTGHHPGASNAMTIVTNIDLILNPRVPAESLAYRQHPGRERS
jgi:DNA-binding SARP family transcriptional activator